MQVYTQFILYAHTYVILRGEYKRGLSAYTRKEALVLLSPLDTLYSVTAPELTGTYLLNIWS